MAMNSPLARRSAALERWLTAKYGQLLTLEELAVVLRYPSIHAIRKARARGVLPVALLRLPARKALVATAASVAALLATLGHQQTAPSARPSTEGNSDAKTACEGLRALRSKKL